MTPKPIQWIGAFLVLGILAVVDVSAIQNVIAGEAGQAEVIILVLSGAVVVSAVILKLVLGRKKTARRRRKRRKSH